MKRSDKEMTAVLDNWKRPYFLCKNYTSNGVTKKIYNARCADSPKILWESLDIENAGTKYIYGPRTSELLDIKLSESFVRWITSYYWCELIGLENVT